MTADDLLQLTGDRLAIGGDAVARDADGRVHFVTGALPGERFEARPIEVHARYSRSELLRVLEPGSARVTPPCQFVGDGCGGCTWQHVELRAQRAAKREMVREALVHIGGFSPAAVDDVPILEGPDLLGHGHRTTVRLSVGENGRLGFQRSRSHDVVEIDHCLVAHPRIDQLIAAAEDAFRGATSVTVRVGARTGELLAVVTPSRSVIDEARLFDAITDAITAPITDPTVDAITEASALRLVGIDELRAGKRAWIHEEIDGCRLRVSAESFFQTSADGAEALVAAVADASADLITNETRIVDAYAGVGLFGATLAARIARQTGQPFVGRVIAVERDASAVADARINLRPLNSTIVRADVGRFRSERADLVIADPSRSGLRPAGAGRLARTGASRLVLVSCDAAAFGRDAALLSKHGYQLRGCTVIDVFPHTPHVEIVSRFDR